MALDRLLAGSGAPDLLKRETSAVAASETAAADLTAFVTTACFDLTFFTALGLKTSRPPTPTPPSLSAGFVEGGKLVSSSVLTTLSATAELELGLSTEESLVLNRLSATAELELVFNAEEPSFSTTKAKRLFPNL